MRCAFGGATSRYLFKKIALLPTGLDQREYWRRQLRPAALVPAVGVRTQLQVAQGDSSWVCSRGSGSTGPAVAAAGPLPQPSPLRPPDGDFGRRPYSLSPMHLASQAAVPTSRASGGVVPSDTAGLLRGGGEASTHTPGTIAVAAAVMCACVCISAGRVEARHSSVVCALSARCLRHGPATGNE